MTPSSPCADSSPFISDVPAETALRTWLDTCAAAGCPMRLEGRHRHVGGRSRPGHRRAGLGDPFLAGRRLRRDGRHRGVWPSDTAGASPTTPLQLGPGNYEVVDTGDPMPDGFDAVVMREHVHYVTSPGPARPRRSWPRCRRTTTCARSARTSAPASCCCRRGIGCARSTSPPQPRRAPPSCVVRRQPRVAVIPTGDEIVPVGSPPQRDQILDTNSLMLVAQAREAGCESWATPIQPDVQERISAAVREAAATADLVIVVAGSSAGRDDYTARRGRRARRSSPCTGSPSAPATRWCSAPSTQRR